MDSAPGHREPERGLRRATRADAAGIAELVRLAFANQSAVTDPPPSALKETADTIARALAEGGGAVIEVGGRLAGCVLWHEEEGSLYVGRLSVHPEHRRRGIARMLMDECEREARRRGLARMHLGVRLPLVDNRRLFATCGFVETGLHAHQGFSEPTSVTMERRLD
jgi:ribosomal protein S18 acetylase RimI-like enzyme